MTAFLFLVALVLAWPTSGLSLVAFFVLMVLRFVWAAWRGRQARRQTNTNGRYITPQISKKPEPVQQPNPPKSVLEEIERLVADAGLPQPAGQSHEQTMRDLQIWGSIHYPELGKLIAQGDRRAFDAVLNGARAGDSTAQFEAGCAYAMGRCVPRDYEDCRGMV